MDQVAERLAELRERRALTLRELSDISGVAADTINQIELGHRKARPSTLRKLARALEIGVQEFYAEPALPKAEAPRGAGQLSAAEEAAMIEGLAAAVEAVADRTRTRLEQTDDTDGDALVALLEDAWLAQRGADQLLEEVNEEAAQKQRETPAERRARSKLEHAVMRLIDLSENIASGLLEGTKDLEWADERAEPVLLDEERRRRRAG
jgi:transcriptional regulator with XRE-family HTH domain